MGMRRAAPATRVIGLTTAGLLLAAGLAAVPAVGADVPADVTPIPDHGRTTLPASTGRIGVGTPITMPAPPQNPHLAANPFNNVHNDSWLTDTARISGPTGGGVRLRSNTLAVARRDPASTFFVCGTLTFDRSGRIISPCVGPGEDSLVLIDPVTLEVITHKEMPVTTGELSAYGSAYMFLDERDRAYITARDHVLVFAERQTRSGPVFTQVDAIDLSAAVPAGDAIQSVMPDWRGRLWFMVQGSGAVGVYDPATRQAKTVQLDGSITNSFAINRSSAYVVSTVRMYRIHAGDDGQPRIAWAADPYENTGTLKPGQKSAGSGTSPTLLDGGRYVAINDNANQMQVVVYRTRTDLPTGSPRTVCAQAVFPAGRGASENSTIAWNRSMVIQNTYGYSIAGGLDSPPTEPGLARVDVTKDGGGCRLVWSNDTVRAPSVGGKVSLPDGMLYTMTRLDDPGTGVATYNWTGIDMATGKVRWTRRAGTGNQWDSYVPGAAIGPTGTVYVGLYGGIASIAAR